MTVNELILIESGKVRRSPDLMAFYIQAFKAAFNYAPNCAGCTFNTDFNKLKNYINTGNKTTLTIKSKTLMGTFKLKKLQGKIHAYRHNKKTFRAYDNNFTDQFVDGFLTHGTKEEIKDRKALFSVLPEKFADKVKVAKTQPETLTSEVKEVTAKTPVKKTRNRKKK